MLLGQRDYRRNLQAILDAASSGLIATQMTDGAAGKPNRLGLGANDTLSGNRYAFLCNVDDEAEQEKAVHDVAALILQNCQRDRNTS